MKNKNLPNRLKKALPVTLAAAIAVAPIATYAATTTSTVVNNFASSTTTNTSTAKTAEKTNEALTSTGVFQYKEDGTTKAIIDANDFTTLSKEISANTSALQTEIEANNTATKEALTGLSDIINANNDSTTKSIADLKKSVSEGKALLAETLTGKDSANAVKAANTAGNGVVLSSFSSTASYSDIASGIAKIAKANYDAGKSKGVTSALSSAKIESGTWTTLAPTLNDKGELSGEDELSNIVIDIGGQKGTVSGKLTNTISGTYSNSYNAGYKQAVADVFDYDLENGSQITSSEPTIGVDGIDTTDANNVQINLKSHVNAYVAGDIDGGSSNTTNFDDVAITVSTGKSLSALTNDSSSEVLTAVINYNASNVGRCAVPIDKLLQLSNNSKATTSNSIASIKKKLTGSYSTSDAIDISEYLYLSDIHYGTSLTGSGIEKYVKAYYCPNATAVDGDTTYTGIIYVGVQINADKAYFYTSCSNTTWTTADGSTIYAGDWTPDGLSNTGNDQTCFINVEGYHASRIILNIPLDEK